MGGQPSTCRSLLVLFLFFLFCLQHRRVLGHCLWQLGSVCTISAACAVLVYVLARKTHVLLFSGRLVVLQNGCERRQPYYKQSWAICPCRYMQNAAPSCSVVWCSQNVACSLSEERFCAAVLQFIAGALSVPAHACEAGWPAAHSRIAGPCARVQQHIRGRV